MYKDKIVILHIPNSTNNGSAMMAINLMHYVSKNYGETVEFYCDFATEYDKKRIQSELSSGIRAYSLALPIFDRGSSLITSFVRRLSWINKVIVHIEALKPKAVVVLGGDDFSEYYSGYKIVVQLYFMYCLSKHFPIYLIGHTVGPFHSWRKLAASVFLSHCKILTRDVHSFNYCKNILRLRNVRRGYDLAWLSLPRQTAELKEKMIAHYNLCDEKYVVLVPSALAHQYTVHFDDYLDTWVKIVKELQKRETLGDYKIVLMPHVFKDKKNDDRKILKALEERILDKRNLVFVYEALLPSECRALLSGSTFSISSRMHASVSTIQTGKPSVALSYSVKYAAVLGEDAGLSDFIIEGRGDHMWQGNIITQLKDKIATIENDYTEICNQIKERVARISKEQTKLLIEFTEMIRHNGGKQYD